MKYSAILFDFDGVLIESEYAGNKQLAEWLTANGHHIIAGTTLLLGVSAYRSCSFTVEWDNRDARAAR